MKHIGVIMDGNRRWAKTHKLELYQGHNKGAESFGNICDWCLQENIPYLTVYAFSTENWKRTDKEIKHLFGLMEKYFLEEKSRCVEKGVRIKLIGERTRFDARTMSIINNIETATAECKKLYVQVALSYGGRDEIVRAAKKIAADSASGVIKSDSITESIFENYLDTAGIPDVDLVIRTGGAENRRLSNFLPWQTIYAELFFSDLMWPEFTREEFNRALEYYRSVKRKLGT
ncbi:MAG: di-trans,poly-cis-decaprenylcistransferase [Clostridiales bacterium]|jgi:undecaprenyl diphosphate synthase|nr:di-trans,poly-cis-decaprenylcistransferase [Clostridiales bacterium]